MISMVLGAVLSMSLSMLGCRGASSVATTPAPAPTASPSPLASGAASTRPRSPSSQARDVEITVLSTSKAEVGQGEWGFSALVEIDGQRVLFDAGAKPKTVLNNAAAAGVDLTTISHVVISHHHDDHVGGLMTLRRAVVDRAPDALATVHVARGMFEPRRYGGKPKEVNDMVAIRPAFEQTGGRFVVHETADEILPGVWVTGPVPRVHPERNWSGLRQLPGDGGKGWADDTLPESQSLVIDTAQGLVVISGCGHAGIVNTLTHAKATIRDSPVRAALGGFHLHKATAEHLDWTAQRLRELDLRAFYGAHCTGKRAVQRFGKDVAPDGAQEVAVGFRLPLPGAEP